MTNSKQSLTALVIGQCIVDSSNTCPASGRLGALLSFEYIKLFNHKLLDPIMFQVSKYVYLVYHLLNYIIVIF